MAYEDLHWSDPTTRELLDLFGRSGTELRVLVVVTSRPEFSFSVGRPPAGQPY